MLKALELENFKAFGERTRIDFAPITLIFGENSAGKSTILQALNLLKQTRESRESGALLLPRTEGGFAELGSFQELLFDHDQSRRLSIRMTLSTDMKTGPDRELARVFWGGSKSLPKIYAFETQFEWPQSGKEVQLGQLTLGLGESEEDFARFAPSKVTKTDFRRFGGPYFYYSRGRRSSTEKDIRAVECTWVAESPEYWESAYAIVSKRLGSIQKALAKMQKDLEGGRLTHRELAEEESKETRDHYARDLFEAAGFYATLPSKSAFVARLRNAQVGRKVLLDGFLPVRPFLIRQDGLPEEMAVNRHSRAHWSPGFGLDVGLLSAHCGHLVDVTLNSLFPMGPFRRPPERWYIYTGTTPVDVGYKGELLPDLLFRTPELVENTNQWLKRLSIGYEIDPRPVGERSGDLFEVRLRDTRRSPSVDVALSDVGFGISQLLPFVVQSLATDRQIISIEQPEVHIHPRLQADLGDLLAEATKKPRWHRFIVETHSEHLVLRLQRLIRSGKLQPDDVSVIFVSRGDKGSIVERLHLDEEGDFVDEWPGGFFPERLRELR